MRWKQWAGIALVLISIAAMYLWETVFRDKVLYTSVPVFASEIAAGEVITADMIKLVRITPQSAVPGALGLEEARAHIGLAAAVPLHKNQQILAEHFAALRSEAGMASFALDPAWIYSQSRLDMAGDTVGLYLVDSGEYLGSYRISALPENGSPLEIAARFEDYLMIRAAAQTFGRGIIVINELCR